MEQLPSDFPIRMCTVCRQRQPKKLLIRYVLTSDGAMVQDVEQKLPGRGYYVCTSARCLERVAKYGFRNRK